MELSKFQEAVLIGRGLLKKTEHPNLEAFSGNALYCRRGMPTMGKYKTVKEVCALTGLTRKHLYYFHHEKVVRAVAYANYSVEGNDGYKLYDDSAVEKLQQIALYYQLGLKRDEIRDIMLAPDYDSNRILASILELQKEKKLHIERNIAALEYLMLVGTKNSVYGALRGISLDELGQMLLAYAEKPAIDPREPADMDSFRREFETLLSAFGHLDTTLLQTPVGTEFIKRIADLCVQNIGADGIPFVLGLFMSALGEGSIAQDISKNISPYHARAVIQYLVDHQEIYTPDTHKTPAGNAEK